MSSKQETKSKSTNWLICVDATPSGTFAFKVLPRMIKEGDKIHVLHVASGDDSKMMTFFESNEKTETKHEDEIKKVLTYYGMKAQEAKIDVILLGSMAGPVQKRIRKVVKELDINHLVLGKRPANWIRQLTTSFSTTKTLMDKVKCDITVAKPTDGSLVPEEKDFRKTLDSQRITSLKKTDRRFGDRLIHFEMSGTPHQTTKSDAPKESVPEEKRVETENVPVEKEQKEQKESDVGLRESEGITAEDKVPGAEVKREEGNPEVDKTPGRLDIEEGFDLGMPSGKPVETPSSVKKEKEVPEQERDKVPAAIE